MDRLTYRDGNGEAWYADTVKTPADILHRLCFLEDMLDKPGESQFPDGDTGIVCCPRCGSGEYLHNEDGNENEYCGQCGQRIDWKKEG